MSSYTLTVGQENHHTRLDIFLTQALSEDIPSRSLVKKLIDAGCVLVNAKPMKANYKVAEKDRVQVDVPKNFLRVDDLEPENIPLDVVYEDQGLLIVNKPVGLLVHPATGIYNGTLVNALLHHCKKLSDANTPDRPGIVHRLDQETSGLMVVAKNNKVHLALAKQFEEHTIRKVYVALVRGKIEFDEGIVDAPLGRHTHNREKRAVLFDESAKDAKTMYRVLQRFPNATYVKLFPTTGRTHQLRVHMAHIGHPILGDAKYGDKKSFSRLALHAKSLGFIHPKTSEYVEFSIPPPKEFTDFFRKEN